MSRSGRRRRRRHPAKIRGRRYRAPDGERTHGGGGSRETRTRCREKSRRANARGGAGDGAPREKTHVGIRRRRIGRRRTPGGTQAGRVGSTKVRRRRDEGETEARRKRDTFPSPGGVRRAVEPRRRADDGFATSTRINERGSDTSHVHVVHPFSRRARRIVRPLSPLASLSLRLVFTTRARPHPRASSPAARRPNRSV